MYPIDAIKVRQHPLRVVVVPRNILMNGGVDTNANSQSDTLRSLQWYDTRWLPNSYGGGNPQFSERHVKCRRWSWCVYFSRLER